MTSDALQRLVARIGRCRICRDEPRGPALPHEPRPVVRLSSTARLLIAGQAPGLRVHESGVPFDDRSGDRLRGWLGVSRETFYDAARINIVPMGFCFPGYDAKGSDLPPRRECRAAWHDKIMPELPDYELFVLIGTYAQDYHLPRLAAGPFAKGLSERVLGWQAIYEASGKRVIVLPHPSWRNTGWLKKNIWFETELLPVLRGAVARAAG